MMGRPQQREEKLFYCGFSLEERIRENHPLRIIDKMIDFGFVRGEVKELYGRRGNPSIDPAVLMKLMFLLFYEQVPSERALMERLGERLDWLWFCGYRLDDDIPNHSVLSKARKRWGSDVFTSVFQRILGQCVDAGLVDGRLVHVDASIVTADADDSGLHPALRLASEQLYKQLDQACDSGSNDGGQKQEDSGPEDTPPSARISSTDPDARLTRKYGKSVLGYKDHRVVDDRQGIITATITTHAAVGDGHVLHEALNNHRWNTGRTVQTAVADKAYGSKENYKDLYHQGVTPCIPHPRRGRSQKTFATDRFVYEHNSESYRCPAGQTLTRREKVRGSVYRYRAARGVCGSCALRSECTKSKSGRQIERHVDQDYVEWADTCLPKSVRKRLYQRRQAKAEGSFADAANCHGFKRARWRGLINVTIQNTLIAAIQNLRKLVKHMTHNAPSGGKQSVLSIYWIRFAHKAVYAFSRLYWASRIAQKTKLPRLMILANTNETVWCAGN